MRLMDPAAFADALGRAIEADVAAAQRRGAAVDAQTCGDKVFIRIDARRGRTLTHAWVTGVSFTGGDGYGISKATYSDNPLKAKQFGADAGRAIARQLAAGFNVRGVTLESK